MCIIGQVTVAMQEDGGRIKAAGKMSHEAFLDWVRTKLEEGWRIDSCYEAGASGYWLHRELVGVAIEQKPAAKGCCVLKASKLGAYGGRVRAGADCRAILGSRTG
jgi:hypothetical protein